MSEQLSKAALQAAMIEGAEDPAFWLRFFLPHWFPSAFPPFMLGVIALVTKKVVWLNAYPEAHEFLLNEFKYAADPSDPDSMQLPVFALDADGVLYMVAGEHENIIMPRGFSKTTILNGCNLHDCCTDGTLFCVYISKSAEHAETQLGNVKAELESNVLLRAAYGDLVPTRADTEKWQADQIQLLNGAILVARGRGGQVRGLNYRARRPNKIVLDDVEDDGSVDSPTVRKATERWFYSAVEKAGQVMEGAIGEDWAQEPLHIVNLGTLLGSECLMMTLAKDPSFSTVRFGAKLNLKDPDDHRMLWEYKMSYETYEKQRNRHMAVGRLAEFTRELDSSIRVTDDTLFPSQFIYSPHVREEFALVAMALDPAISEDRAADHAALVVVGRRAADGLLVALDEWGGQGKSPRDKIDAFFAMYKKWRPDKTGIEAVQYQKALIYLMREEMAKTGLFFHIEAIFQGKELAKDERIIAMLSPRYSNGFLHHAKRLPGLEGNILDWPNGKKDYADAASMALTMLGQSGMLAIPEAERGGDDYAPLETRLPPAYQTVSGYITRGTSQKTRREQRYPIR